MKADVAF